MFEVDRYTMFTAPNAEELTQFVMSLEGDTGEEVDKIELLWQDVRELIIPSVNHLSRLHKKAIDYDPTDPWVNLYNEGGCKEIHDHHEHDFSCVFFANSGDNFSEFFFFDWDSGMIVPILYEPGSIMFFSAKMAHGVSIHKNEVQRRTLSCNFKILGL